MFKNFMNLKIYKNIDEIRQNDNQKKIDSKLFFNLTYIIFVHNFKIHLINLSKDLHVIRQFWFLLWKLTKYLKLNRQKGRQSWAGSCFRRRSRASSLHRPLFPPDPCSWTAPYPCARSLPLGFRIAIYRIDESESVWHPSKPHWK